jgi:tripartite-type tricarboxylate transporter receptor subunit TctC
MRSSITISITIGTAGLLAAGALALPAAPAGAADFYSGKTVTLFIGSGVGGSVDLMARLGARHVAEHIPGHPTVIAKNKDGAGGILAANDLYRTAPKDGTQIGTTLMTVPFEPLFYGERSIARFDPLKFEWIGSPAKFISVSLAWHTSPIKKAEDLLTHEMVVGSAGAGSASTIDSFVMRNVLGFKYRVILGYPSGSDIDLAMERGETQGRASDAWAGITSRHMDWVKNGTIRILYQMGLKKHPGIPGSVPLGIDFAKNPEDRAVLKLKMSSFEIGYPIFAPPGTPADRVAILRKAFADTFTDPAYLADAKKADVEVEPITGEEIASILKEAYCAPADVKARLVAASKRPSEVEQVKTVKVSSGISEVGAKGLIGFTDNGKPVHAKIAGKTKVTVDGAKADAKALKVGMNCDIEYYGDMGQAKAVVCK